MTEYGGYTGRLLRVDLDEHRIDIEPTPSPEKWLGARGWNILIGWREVPPGTDPYDPENRIVFSTGVLTGTGAPTAGRTTISSIGPRGYPQPMWTSSSMGGYWGAELKYAGYDCIVVQGKSSTPCYILIEDEKVTIEDGSGIWGQGVHHTQQMLKDLHSPQHQCVVIGPAGENQVRYASIIHRLSNASGNAGFGGVMGAKNLKAIAVRGTRGVRIHDPQAFLDVMQYTWDMTKGGLRCAGQPDRGYPSVACSHGCSVNCFTRIQKPPNEIWDSANLRMMKCNNSTMVRRSHFGYEGESSTGGKLSIPQPQGYDELGLDLGNMLDDLGMTAWTWDTWYRYFGSLQKMGITTVLGEPLHIDDAIWWRDLITNIAFRKGLGNELAEDLPRFYDTHRIGPSYLADFLVSKGSRGHAWHRDGRALESHPSPFWEYSALLYAVSTRDVTPSTHGFFFLQNIHRNRRTSDVYSTEIPQSVLELSEKLYGSPEAIKPGDTHIEYVTRWHQHRAIIKDSLGLCDFIFPVTQRTHESMEARKEAISKGADDIIGDVAIEAKLYRACTGIDIDINEMESPVAERIVNLERSLDVRNHGRNREIDEQVIPHFQWGEKTDGTSLSVSADEFRALLDRFYDLRGWDKKTGVPTQRTLQTLGLDEVYVSEDGRLTEHKSSGET